MNIHTSSLTDELQKYFGFNRFKSQQETIIKNTLDGNDAFVIMPTGGGKSMCYQLPALIRLCHRSISTNSSNEESSRRYSRF